MRSSQHARRWFLAFLLTITAFCSEAGQNPVIEIVLDGNDATRDEILLRELPFKPGDPYDATLAELGRQQIQNLGLFKSVTLSAQPVGDGMRLIYSVDEKWFWQAYPRLSANSDGQNSVGLEARVSNLWGLNHSLRFLGRSRDTRDKDRDRDLSIRGSYTAPNLLGVRDSLRIGAAHNVVPYEEPVVYDETIDELEALATRTLGLTNQPSQGWAIGLGLGWRRHRVTNEAVARSFGDSVNIVTELGYRDVRNLIFSREGMVFDARYELARDAWLSDYSYSILRMAWEQSAPVGQRPHQQVAYGLSLGVGNHALDHRALFSLGGSEGLRGYERKAFEGNSFYLAHIEFMRPLFWDSLRGTVGLELGNADWENKNLFDSPKLSVNFGLRLRPRRLVDFELEIGFGIPLSGEDPRFYGGKVEQP